MIVRSTYFLLVLFISLTNASAQAIKSIPAPVRLSNINTEGELYLRSLRNYNRLESEIYTPRKAFPEYDKVASVEWPGDIEGRLMLGLILHAQGTHRRPKYLDTMLGLLPKRMNYEGYFGPLQKEIINEQQLSGNGWVLRALCEYFRWRKDPNTKIYIKKIIQNLALPTLGAHKGYPIDTASRSKNVGAASGTTQATIGRWKLSSDIGCDFIFMDGIVQAYEIVPSEPLRNLIEEMIARFLQMDLRGINAQTHASLSGLRAILRYYTITGKPYLIKEASLRYNQYFTEATTANFENFNWFGRPEWTEPCGIVDSYLLAVELWQVTSDPKYLEDAHHIYFNALANTQRFNGGFGLSNCPVPGANSLKVVENEAWWCCTMRGAEGLVKAMQYAYFTKDNDIIIPFFNNNIASLRVKDKTIVIRQTTQYPFNGSVSLEILKTTAKSPVTLKLISPSWSINHNLKLNGVDIPFTIKNGFVTAKIKMVKGSRLVLSFDQKTQVSRMANQAYSKPDYRIFSYGPLLLGFDNTLDKTRTILKARPHLLRLSKFSWKIKGSDYQLTPVYHLMDSSVTKQSGHSQQILFKIGT